MPAPKLTYVKNANMETSIHLAFVAGNIPLEDNSICSDQTKKVQENAPFGKVPTLELNGMVFAQCTALARYGGKLSGIYPKDPEQALQVDMIIDAIRDLALTDTAIESVTDKMEKHTKTERLLHETLPMTFRTIEKRIKGKYLLGDKLSLADVALFDFTTNVLAAKYQVADLPDFPKIMSAVERVKHEEGIKTYLSK